MPVQSVSTRFRIEIDGRPLAEDAALVSASVADHIHLPDSFAFTFSDPQRRLLASIGAKIGSKAHVSVDTGEAGGATPLIVGEITALEVEIHAGSTYTVVRGYDESHRLHRGRRTEAHRNVTYADIAAKVAKRLSLEPGVIDATSPSHVHVTQANETDWELLWRLAGEVGFEVAVAEGRLHFRKPARSDQAPAPQARITENPLALTVGSNLLSLRAVVTAAEQVAKVEARGWDAAAKRPVVGRADVASDEAQPGLTASQLAGSFPEATFTHADAGLDHLDRADRAATAVAARIASSAAELEGRARGNPKLRAGTAINLSLAGAPFDGRYVLSSTVHSYDPDDGYVTSFTITGRQDRSLLGLVRGGGASAAGATGPAGGGPVPAVVEDVDDPDHLGRVRLRFPWLSDEYTSDWCRTLQAGAGRGRGWLVVPEVGDEVLVAFEQGVVGRPYVLGGLHNGTDLPEAGFQPLVDPTTRAVNTRRFTSRKGHYLAFVDADGDEAVVLATAGDGLLVRLDATRRTLEVRGSGDLMIEMTGDVTVVAGGALELQGATVKVSGNTIDLN